MVVVDVDTTAVLCGCDGRCRQQDQRRAAPTDGQQQKGKPPHREADRCRVAAKPTPCQLALVVRKVGDAIPVEVSKALGTIEEPVAIRVQIVGVRNAVIVDVIIGLSVAIDIDGAFVDRGDAVVVIILIERIDATVTIGVRSGVNGLELVMVSPAVAVAVCSEGVGAIERLGPVIDTIVVSVIKLGEAITVVVDAVLKFWRSWIDNGSRVVAVLIDSIAIPVLVIVVGTVAVLVDAVVPDLFGVWADSSVIIVAV